MNVFPTENYYYFTFIHGGMQYAGNISIEPADDGKVTVHQVGSEWQDEGPLTHVVLDGSWGVGGEKIERLVCRLTYGGRSVVFALNDLSNVRPPPGTLAPGETFIGPVFDVPSVSFSSTIQLGDRCSFVGRAFC